MELTQQQKQQKLQTEECCPQFHPEKWDNKTLTWNHKPFIKASVPAIAHQPSMKMLGVKITELMQKAEASKKLNEDKEDILLLFNDPSDFQSDMYLSVTEPVPNANNEDISGKFMSKVFDGPFKDISKFFEEMNAYLRDQDKEVKDYYLHYAYCPKCAEKFGHNYMVLFAEIED